MFNIKDIMNSVTKDSYNQNGMIEINNVPDVPTSDYKIEFLYFLMKIQSIILGEQGVVFPNSMDTYYIDIPYQDLLSKNEKEAVTLIYDKVYSEKEKLEVGKSFLKFQLLFEKNPELPDVRIHFYTFHHRGTINLRYESYLYKYTFFPYDENIFTKSRIQAMDKNKMSFRFIEVLPNVSLCAIFFENGELKPLQEFEKYVSTW